MSKPWSEIKEKVEYRRRNRVTAMFFYWWIQRQGRG